MRLFAAFALALLLIISLALLSGQDKIKPATPQHETANQPPNQQPPSTTVEVNVGYPKETEERQTAKHDADSHAMTSFEKLISLITFIYSLFSVLTFFAIKRQAKAAEGELAAQSPWIMVDIQHAPGMHGRFLGTSKTRDEPETHHTDFLFRFDCTNFGRTPALIIEKRALLIIVPENSLPRTPNLSATKIFDGRAEPLASDKKSVSEKDFWFTVTGYQGPNDWVVLYGAVKYRDVFGRDRRTTFGYQVTQGDELERLSGSYSKYNENT